MVYTRRQLEAGEGLFTRGHSSFFQRGDEDVFLVADGSNTPAPGWHVAGGGRKLTDGTISIEWCDLR